MQSRYLIEDLSLHMGLHLGMFGHKVCLRSIAPLLLIMHHSIPLQEIHFSLDKNEQSL